MDAYKGWLFKCVFLLGLYLLFMHAQKLCAQDDFHFEGSSRELVNYGLIDTTDLQKMTCCFLLMRLS